MVSWTGYYFALVVLLNYLGVALFNHAKAPDSGAQSPSTRFAIG